MTCDSNPAPAQWGSKGEFLPCAIIMENSDSWQIINLTAAQWKLDFFFSLPHNTSF